jgi:hypothetical protein
MFGFGSRQVTPQDLRDEVAACRSEISRLASTLRQLEGEQALMHDQVRKWMRRAVAAENRATPAPEPEAVAAPVATQMPMWGARARRLARLSRPDPAEELANGVHP